MPNDLPTPAISILTTCYNREKYLGECIQSVLDGHFQDFELIIVDDGSTDRSVEIAKEFEARDARIRVHQNEKNLGDYPNRNKAASYARGKYIKYVDADDMIYPWGLNILYESMELFPHAGWGLCSLSQDRFKPYPFVLEPSDAYRHHYLGPGLFNKAPLSSIIRTDLFKEVGGFNTYSHAGDFDMWHRLGKRAPVVLMSHGAVWYREHDAQSSNSQHLHHKQYSEIQNMHLQSPDCPMGQAEIAQARKRSSYRKFKNKLFSQLQTIFN